MAQRAAARRLQSAEEAVEEVAQDIETTQNELGQALNGHDALDLDAIQASRAYLAQRQNIHKQCLSELRDAAQETSRTDIQVRRAALTVRALERRKQQTDREIQQVVTTRLQELDLELWLQSAREVNDD